VKMHMIRTFFAAGLGGGAFQRPAVSHRRPIRSRHVAAAKAAAVDRHDYIFNSLCVRPSAGPNTGSVDEASPDPSVFQAEPVVGEKEYSA